MACTIASTVRFAADKAGVDVGAERVTDTDSDAWSGVIITEPWPSTVSVCGVGVAASAAGATLSQMRTTPAAVRTYTENSLRSARRLPSYACPRPPSRD